jgi:hypothetical protein
MSISLEPTTPTAEAQALSLLKGKDNPFEALVRPQQADTDFTSVHVPQIHQEERGQLLEMIDWYRVEQYRDSEDLKPTRVVTVRGDRGSGKTHLLQSLLARPDGRPQLLVRPSFFEASLPFDEYLLGQIKAAVAQEDEFHADRPLDVVARALTRRLLRQALLSMDATERLFAFSEQPPRWGLLGGGGGQAESRAQALLAELPEANVRDVPALLREHGLAPEMACRLVEGHLRERETGAGLLLNLRKQLYSAVARSVLLQDTTAIQAFLAEGYRQADPTGSAARAELVSTMLHIIVESCALVRLPVVIALDNLERLLSPQGRFDDPLTDALVMGMAQAVDGTSGLLFLVFAESGLFDRQLLPRLDVTYARARFEQGVPVAGRGPVFLIDLKPPVPAAVRELVRARVGPLVAEVPGASMLPQGFPFAEGFLADLTGVGGSPLRNLLLRLRDEYNRVVFDRRPELIEAPREGAIEPDWPRLLEAAWNRSIDRVRRNFRGPVPHQELHSCLGALLLAALPLEAEGWSLERVEPVAAVGQNLDYGVVTRLHWRRAAEGSGPANLTVAVGFLLAGGPGMAPDLAAKFDAFEGRERGVRLVVLWPTQNDADDLAALLPRITRQAWEDQQANHWRTDLRRTDELGLRRVLAFADLVALAEEAAGEAPPPAQVRDFLHARFSWLFPLLVPPDRPQKG